MAQHIKDATLNFSQYRDNLNESVDSDRDKEEEEDEETLEEDFKDAEAATIPSNPAQIGQMLNGTKMDTEKITKVLTRHGGQSTSTSDPIQQMIDKFQSISISNQGYIASDEQAERIRYLELTEASIRAEYNSKLKQVVSLIADKESPAVKNLIEKLDEDLKRNITIGQIRDSHLKRAQKVASKYKTNLEKPTINEVPQNYTLGPQRTSPREIISVTGKFNPANDKADFAHIWSKLTGYGTNNYFQEDEYKTALQYILEGDAYEAFKSMLDENESLQYIIDYFGKVYGKKRSIFRDRAAVDKFTRLKNEPLDVCMHRSLIVIDKLKHLHSREAWPEIRNNYRRQILAQVTAEETWNHVKMEENDIVERTGMHIDMDRLISMADKYELIHNKVPNKDITTAFQVASGGFSHNIEQLKMENQHLKKANFEDKQKITEFVQELLANPARLYKNEGRSQSTRESRKTDRQNDRRDARSQSFNRNRNIDPPDTVSSSKEREATPTRVNFQRSETPPPFQFSAPPRRDRSFSGNRERFTSGQPMQTDKAQPYYPPQMSNPPPRNDQGNNRANYRSDSQDRRSYNQTRDYRPRSQSRENYRSNYNRNSSYNRGRTQSRDRANTPNGYGNRNQSRDRRGNYRSQSRDRQSYNNYNRNENNSYYRNERGRSPFRSRNGDSYGDSRPETPNFEKSVMIHINGAHTGNSKSPPQ